MSTYLSLDEAREMPIEQRQELDRQVPGRIVRHQEQPKLEQAYAEYDLPGHQRAAIIYYGEIGMTLPDDHPPVVPAQNFTGAMMFVPPGHHVPLHTHTTEEMFLVLEGAFEAQWGAEGEHSERIGVWDTVSFPAGVIHGLLNVGEDRGALWVSLGGDHTNNAPLFVEDVLEQVRAHENDNG